MTSRFRERLWPTLIVLLLAANAGGSIALARAAADDPHAAIEPDYYRKAVAWDSTMAQERRNTALGWQAAPELAAIAANARTPLTIALADAAGAPVAGATVHVEAMAVAKANDVERATLTEVAPGRYLAPMRVRRAGLWDVRLSAVRGGERFTRQLRLDVAIDAPARPVP